MTPVTSIIAQPALGSPYACIFPGQGSQQVGMGHAIYQSHPAAKAVFEQADEVLGQHLSRLMFEGPLEVLSLTSHAQPALLTASIALYAALESEGVLRHGLCQQVAGHSLGEYSALVVSGALSFEDALRLVQRRGQAMQEAVAPGQGGMLAVLGASDAQLMRILAEATAEGDICDLANDNAPGQVVISGSILALDRATATAQSVGVRTISLPVSGPFHSRLMHPVQSIMDQALQACRVSAPTIPTIANISAQPVTTPNQVRDGLVAQITGGVRWVESIRYMIAQGSTLFIEIGSGKVLTGLMRRIDRAVDAVSCQGPEDIAAVLASVEGKAAL